MKKELNPNFEIDLLVSSRIDNHMRNLSSFNKVIHSGFHDLCVPLCTIKPYVDFLKEIDDKEKEQIILERMKTAVEKMEMIMKRFVEYADLLWETNPQIDLVNIYQEIDKVKKGISLCFPELNYSINTSFDSGLEILFPEKYIHKVFAILIENTIRYRETDKDPCIDISVCKVDDGLTIRFKDNGTGFPEYFDKTKAFTPFEKSAHPNRGIGLGLVYLKQIVEKNGGTVDFNSSNEGTIFRIKLQSYKLTHNQLEGTYVAQHQRNIKIN
jgi:light-regulated signal transduction histidine kinase (bacteriophytochrome)